MNPHPVFLSSFNPTPVPHDFRSMPWSQGHLTRHMRVASSSSCSAVPLTIQFIHHGSSSSPLGTTLSVSIPTSTAMAKYASASWGESWFLTLVSKGTHEELPCSLHTFLFISWAISSLFLKKKKKGKSLGQHIQFALYMGYNLLLLFFF